MEMDEYEILLWLLADRPLIFNIIAIISLFVIAETLSICNWIKKLIEHMRFKRDQDFWAETL